MPTVAVSTSQVPLPADPWHASAPTPSNSPTRPASPLQTYRVDAARPGSGIRRPVGTAARRAGRAGRGGDGLGGRPTAPRTSTGSTRATRSRAPCRAPSPSTTRATASFRRSRAARPLLGGARLVEHGLDVERAAPRRRHPPARRGHPDPGAPPMSASATFSAPADRSSSCRPVTHEKRSAPTGYRWPPNSTLNPGDVTASVDGSGPRASAADRRRRSGEPVPARVGHRDHHRRPHRRRLDGMEPQPGLTALAPRAPLHRERPCLYSDTPRKVTFCGHSWRSASSAQQGVTHPA